MKVTVGQLCKTLGTTWGTTLGVVASMTYSLPANAQKNVFRSAVQAPVAPTAPLAPKDLLASDRAFVGAADTSALRAAANVPEMTIESSAPHSGSNSLSLSAPQKPANTAPHLEQNSVPNAVPPLATPELAPVPDLVSTTNLASDLSASNPVGESSSAKLTKKPNTGAPAEQDTETSSAPSDGALSTSANSSGKPGEKTQSGTAPESTEAGSLAPLNFASETAEPFEFNLWQSVSIVTFLLAAVGTGGYMMVRLKNKGGFGLQKSEKQMTVVSSLAIGPKRTILLLKIRDQEIAVASTEHGIQFLSEILPTSRSSRSLSNAGTSMSTFVASETELPRTLPRRAQSELRSDLQGEFRTEARSGTSSAPNGTRTETRASTPESTRAPEKNSKSEILLGALKNLKSKAPGADKKEAPVPRPESTLKQTRGSFPKYLANAFEQESKRPLSSQNAAGQAGPSGSAQSSQSVPPSNGAAQRRSADSADSEENVESVTNMIREKLKEMRPLS